MLQADRSKRGAVLQKLKTMAESCELKADSEQEGQQSAFSDQLELKKAKAKNGGFGLSTDWHKLNAVG